MQNRPCAFSCLTLTCITIYGKIKKTSMQAADINGDGTVTEADKEIGIDFALTGSSTYLIGETVENPYPCVPCVRKYG